jgi:hypothetical protein
MKTLSYGDVPKIESVRSIIIEAASDLIGSPSIWRDGPIEGQPQGWG